MEKTFETRTLHKEKMGVEFLRRQGLDGEAPKIGTARFSHGGDHRILRGNVRHSYLGDQTMFPVYGLQCVAVLLWLRVLYLLDEES